MNIDISKFTDCKILVAGDLMIDEYLWGDVDRISPEAPVQIVTVSNEDFTLGGSGNVVNNLADLGANVYAAGVIGTGINAELILEILKKLGVDTTGVMQTSERPTIKKTRIIAANQHVLRIDRETRQPIPAQLTKALFERAEKLIPSVDIILISDYGKGVVTHSLVDGFVNLARKHNKLILADPKGLDFSKYAGVSIITPNKKEAGLAAGIEITDDSTLEKAGRILQEKAGIDNILITCGKNGMALFEKNKKMYHVSAKARQVYDVSGAGDTVLAVLGLAMASGATFKQGIALANSAAGIVVGKIGTATVSPLELTQAVEYSPDERILKHRSAAELIGITEHLKKKGKKIVFTNGCFDLLHVGHIMFFTAAKSLGDILIVALDDDDSVKKLKGSERPVISVEERVKIISALDVVDYVVIFSTDKLNELLKTIKPDVLTKGSNYSTDEVIGHEIVEKLGGQVIVIPVSNDITTSRIINSIRGRETK